jgi:hypothetical protein
MATGVYGTNKLANVLTSDIEIFYTYSPNRDSAPTLSVQTLPSESLSRFTEPGKSYNMDGLYNLQLPVEQFSSKGIYNIIIRPREYETTIVDCSVLSSFPDVKGVVLDITQLDGLTETDLIGARIDYIENGQKNGKFTIITSVNRAIMVPQNVSNSTQKSTSYTFNQSSDLIFCTITPSSSSTVQPNKFPTIGEPGQSVVVSKGNFNPIIIEVEMVEHDIETLAYGLFGNQSKGIQDGVYTIYNFDNEIYKQYKLYQVQDEFTGEPLYEVREENVDDIDETKDFDNIINFPTR